MITWRNYIMVMDMLIDNTKDLFKGDFIDFEGIIYDYDEENKVLFCRDPVYKLHEDK